MNVKCRLFKAGVHIEQNKNISSEYIGVTIRTKNGPKKRYGKY